MPPTDTHNLGDTLETRKLSELKANNPYLRLGTDVSDLEKSIQTIGLIAPIVISNENTILAGARRYQALSNLGYTEAPVKVIEGNALERELVSIDENLVRKDLSKIEIETHLRRAKEIYQELHPVEEVEIVAASENEDGTDEEVKVKKTVLPAQAFLEMVSEKTGYSPKQIHEAITRDEKASPATKAARQSGKLSVGQTNEIVKLEKEDQEIILDHVRELPLKEMKKIVKIAQEQGVQEAINQTPANPFLKEMNDLESLLKRAVKKMKTLEEDGFDNAEYSKDILKSIKELNNFIDDNSHNAGYDSNYEDNSIPTYS